MIMYAKKYQNQPVFHGVIQQIKVALFCQTQSRRHSIRYL